MQVLHEMTYSNCQY